jgi:hypothetical protein
MQFILLVILQNAKNKNRVPVITLVFQRINKNAKKKMKTRYNIVEEKRIFYL